MKVSSIISSGALACTALVASALIIPARTLSAETIGNESQNQKQVAISTDSSAPTVKPEGGMGTLSANLVTEAPVAEPTSYVATAYSLRGRTASGLYVNKGLIAADPRFLPLGSRVRLDAGDYSGEYLVADTGAMVKGRRIDIWTPTSREAMRFGRRTVKLTILSYGGKRRAAHAGAAKTK